MNFLMAMAVVALFAFAFYKSTRDASKTFKSIKPVLPSPEGARALRKARAPRKISGKSKKNKKK